MFLTLLTVTFFVATAVTIVVAYAFSRPVDQIFRRILGEEISVAWWRYLMFALYVVGISSGVRMWELERYITKPFIQDAEVIELTRDRWILEVYRSIIATLQGLAWVLLVFFIVALMAFVVVRIFETRNPPREDKIVQGKEAADRG
jgi:large-conductance mechanosensitive channel